MAEPGPLRVALFASSWGRPHDEQGFVARAIAGALSRVAAVDVLVPGPVGPPTPDGAFDPVPVGVPAHGLATWPAPDDVRWRPAADYRAVVLDRPTPALRELATGILPGVPVIEVTGDGEARLGAAGGDLAGSLVVGAGGRPQGAAPPAVGAHRVGLHVAVNPLATAQRHGGLGFTGYVLVLTDRSPPQAQGLLPDPDREPTPAVAWLAARFTGRITVAIEDGVASVWGWRSRLGSIAVATRMDLWRLLSHAAVVVDLAPGPLVARECVETLRFGVPVVTPAGSAGHLLAAAGGGLWYRDVAELLGCVETMGDPAVHAQLAQQGRAVAERWYGDPAGFVERVGAALAAITADRSPTRPDA